MVYRRFETGAEAIRHVIESVEPASLPGAVIETDESRLEAADIRAIYESTDFPLARRVNKARISGADAHQSVRGLYSLHRMRMPERQ